MVAIIYAVLVVLIVFVIITLTTSLSKIIRRRLARVDGALLNVRRRCVECGIQGSLLPSVVGGLVTGLDTLHGLIVPTRVRSRSKALTVAPRLDQNGNLEPLLSPQMTLSRSLDPCHGALSAALSDLRMAVSQLRHTAEDPAGAGAR